jgi:hypothetical protein
VIVTDERGNKYEATYPKRAKGLVKKGRARFIGENEICLTARPPNSLLEDDCMNEHTYTSPANEAPEMPNDEAAYSIGGILSRISSILSDTSYIRSALDTLSEIPLQGGHDIGAANKAEAIAHVVEAREATNQQTLRFLERMYIDLVPQRIPPEIVKFREIVDSLKGFEDLDEEFVAGIIEKAASRMLSEQPIHVHNNYAAPGIPNIKFGGKAPKMPHMPERGGNPYHMDNRFDEDGEDE